MKRSIALPIAALVLGGSARGYPDSAAIVAEINRVRTDPAGYAEMLRDYRRGFEADGIRHRPIPTARPTPTLEGVAAVDEAIAVLNAAKPAPALDAAEVLQMSAGDLASAQGASGQVGHAGGGGATPGERVQRRGGQPYGVAEAISYGQMTPADIVRQLVVDGGVPSRGHRRILLNPYFRAAGAWCGPHRRHGSVCVIDVAARDSVPR